MSLALEQGFNAFLPVYDGGVDFILYRESDGAIRKVQLKGRWMIDKKYIGRDIWMAFPLGADWVPDAARPHARARRSGREDAEERFLDGRGRLLEAEAIGGHDRRVRALQVHADCPARGRRS